MFDPVTVAIPDARKPEQARSNAAASALPPLSDTAMAELRAIYDRHIRPQIRALIAW